MDQKLYYTKIKDLNAKDENPLGYTAYNKFESCQSFSEMTIADYINELERSYSSIKHHDMELPTGVLGFCVLKNTNISSEKQLFVRKTMTLLTYECMKQQLLKAIYDNSVNSISILITLSKKNKFY